MIYSDFRIGGMPRYILADKPPSLMFIPDQIRKCVAFVAYRLPNDELSFQGTAFFLARPTRAVGKIFTYLVTARHVIEGIESRSPDGKVFLRINLKDGDAISVETDVSQWIFHPDESEVDVAVCRFPMSQDFLQSADIRLLPFSILVNDEVKSEYSIGLGDEVFLTGLFYNHRGRSRNIPIVRVGNIAAVPEEKVLTKLGLIDAYLVEARSIGGLSGSPVFVHIDPLRRLKKDEMIVGAGGNTPSSLFYLLGLMHGHYDAELVSTDLLDEDAALTNEQKREIVNMGIAIVVPYEKILEVINQPMIREPEEIVEKKLMEELLPTPDSVQDELTKESFEDALKRASRKTSESE